MRAAVLYAPLTPFRVEACGICRSDHHRYDGSAGKEFPIVLGHEAAGMVEAVGPGVTGLRPGQRVILTVRRRCGACADCVAGRPELCQTLRGRGGVVSVSNCLVQCHNPGCGRIEEDPLPVYLPVRTGA